MIHFHYLNALPVHSRLVSPVNSERESERERERERERENSERERKRARERARGGGREENKFYRDKENTFFNDSVCASPRRRCSAASGWRTGDARGLVYRQKRPSI